MLNTKRHCTFIKIIPFWEIITFFISWKIIFRRFLLIGKLIIKGFFLN